MLDEKFVVYPRTYVESGADQGQNEDDKQPCGLGWIRENIRSRMIGVSSSSVVRLGGFVLCHCVIQ